jgi:cell division protein FtsN
MKSQKGEKGGFVLGLIVGLLVGLALALGVALYVTKVPVPFVNKVPQRTPEQDAAEAERNKNWDPNAPLAGKPVKPASAPQAASGAALPSPSVVVQPQTGNAPPAAPASVGKSTRDPAAILSGQTVSPAAAPMVSGKTSAKTEAAAFTYFVQAGAFGKPEDAEQQRAKLAMMGLAAKVTEREQSGRTVYRVRVGPFDRKEEADAAQEKLQAASVESALVRVENAAH